MKNISETIENLILECECDNRIESGIFDLYNTDHLIVMAEHIQARGLNEDMVDEMIEAMAVDEGKHPERQAFNKEGWLVTFPSKEYRDAAIKKGTHSISDPTHGKGGMNLYYKRKGKQKRQTQQTVSKTEPTDQVAKPQPQAPSAEPAEPVQAKKRSPEQEKQYQDAVSRQPIPSKSKDDLLKGYITAKSKGSAAAAKSSTTAATDSEPQQAAQPQGAPAIDVPVVTTPPAQYADVSQKFAKQKGWTITEYGEYRDKEGNPVAVVGLSGEVVPIRSNDREEYKIFAEKQMSA